MCNSREKGYKKKEFFFIKKRREKNLIQKEGGGVENPFSAHIGTNKQLATYRPGARDENKIRFLPPADEVIPKRGNLKPAHAIGSRKKLAVIDEKMQFSRLFVTTSEARHQSLANLFSSLRSLTLNFLGEWEKPELFWKR